jgi:competence protein ComEA
MSTKPFLRPPPALTSLVVVIFLAVLLSREACTTQALPAFLFLERDDIHVELIGAGLVPGAYQINDGLSFSDVIKLTGTFPGERLSADPVWSQLVRNGESIKFVRKDREIDIMRQGWMRASHRVAMAIPLHPDRMSRSDWTVLPGVGAALAERIDADRQKNGDFGTIDSLIRVAGIGKKRIKSWKKFFVKA